MKSYTVTELKKIAKQRGIKGFSKMNKQELYSLLDIGDYDKLTKKINYTLYEFNLPDNKGYLEWYKNIHSMNDEIEQLKIFIDNQLQEKIKFCNEIEKIEWNLLKIALLENKVKIEDILKSYPTLRFDMNKDDYDIFISCRLFENPEYLLKSEKQQYLLKSEKQREPDVYIKNPLYIKEEFKLDRNDIEQYLWFLYPNGLNSIMNFFKINNQKLFEKKYKYSCELIYISYQQLEVCIFGRKMMSRELFDIAIRLFKLLN